MTRVWTKAAAAALVLLSSTFALAADETPDGWIEFSGGSAAVGVGVKWGKGTLYYRGQAYPFQVSGLSLVDLGGSEINGSGEVYHLAKVGDFTGDYSAVAAGATVERGESSAAMRNEHGGSSANQASGNQTDNHGFWLHDVRIRHVALTMPWVTVFSKLEGVLVCASSPVVRRPKRVSSQGTLSSSSMGSRSTTPPNCPCRSPRSNQEAL